MQKAKLIFIQTLIVSAAILFWIGIQGLISHFSFGSEWLTLKWYTPLSIYLAGFLCSLPSYILFDLDRLKKSAVRIRYIIHFILVGGIVSFCGMIFTWYQTSVDFLILLLIYILIYVFVWVVTAWLAKENERKINEAIKHIQDAE